MQDSSRQEPATRVPFGRTAGFRRWFLPAAIAVVALACAALPSGTSVRLHAAGMAAQETDTDGDTMPDAWEDFFGLDPEDAADATGDPDNDGLTNAQEFAAHRHPRGHHVRYFAEGSTGYFDTSVAVLNLSPTDTAHVALALLSESGGVVSHRFTLGPRQRQSVSINTVLGVAGAVAIIVESDVAVAADRFMTWGTSGIGASLDSGASAPATTWYFAEGATGPFFLYYLLQNPATTPATVTLRYLVEAGSPVTRTHTLPPHSRTTIFVNEDDPAVAHASLGAILTSNVPIFAERAMYLDGGGTLGGGAASAGSPQLSTQWYFGEGATGPFFQAFLAMLNPGTTAAAATVTYHLADGSTVSKAYAVPAEGRRTVWFNGEAASDPALAALATGPVWFTVHSTQPILGERAMWWATWPWYEGHAAPGSTTTGVSWAVPEGRDGGPTFEQTYVLIGNTTPTAGQVRVTLIPDTGAASTRDLPIAAGQRLTVNIGSLFGLTDARFSVIVDSLGAPGVPLAVDYARYRSVNGLPFSGGGAAPAVLVPAGDTAPSVSSSTPAANATGVAVDANLTVTFSEPVTVGAGAFVLECPANTPIALTNLTASPATAFTLDPSADLPVSTACTLRVVASQVTDVDTTDPPDAMAADVVVPFTTAACATITVSPTTVPDGFLNQPYGPVTFTQAGGVAPITWSLTAGALPGGMNLSAAGVLAGTPAALGSFTSTVTATDANACAGAVPLTLAVQSGAPTFTSASATTFTVGSPGTFTVTAVGSPTPALSVSGALPAGVTFVDNGDGTGTLTGTPGAGTGGSYALTFTASNGVPPDGTQTFTLNVNALPAVTSAGSATFPIGAPGSFTVTASGFPLPALARGGVVLPAGVTFVDNGNGTGTLSGTPAAGTGGTYAISFVATNAAGAGPAQAFTLIVSGAPSITSASTTTFTAGSPGTFTVTAVGSPTPAISVSGALPSGVTFVDNGDGTGTLSGTPAAGTAGSYALTFTGANGTLPSAVQAFTLNVNQPPAITSAATTAVTVGTPGSFTVTTTGFPAPTVSQGGPLPAGITFTPATRILGGTATQTGTFDAIQFTATNGTPPDAVQSFTLNVVCPSITVNPATMPDGLFQVAYAGGTFTQTGSTGSSITWSATGLPAGLTIGATTGAVSGTPTDTVSNAAVSVTATDNFGCASTRNTTITVRPTTDDETFMGGVGNTQYVVGAAVPSTPHVFANDNVKTGDNGPGVLTVTFPATASNGLIVEGATDGTFTYTPTAGFAGPTDTFTYTLTDGNGVTNTGTVTINLSNVLWYVNSAGGNGDGRSHNPFNSLANAAAASSANQSIYVHSGGATTPGNIALDANQTLHGQGDALVLNNLVILAGARPTLTGTVTLGNNTAVRAVNFTPSAIPAMIMSGLTQPVAIDQVDVAGGTNALSLTNVSGAVTVTSAIFTNTTGAEVLISQGTGNVSIGATISSNAGRSIDIQNRTSGTVTFTGAITDTGQGIFLSGNSGSTINFTGGLALSTTINPAFTATGGGTVSATQNNTTIVNAITTSSGTALNVANTVIGAPGLTFRSISANGATNGIILSNTGSSGGLTVSGNGGTCTPAAPTCSGGRIQNTTGADSSSATPVGTGIVLNNTSNVSLTLMRLDNHSNYAIRGTSVDGFALSSSLVDGANGTNVSTPFNDGSLVFFGVTGTSSGMTGTSSIANSTIQGGFQRNIAIDNSVGTLNLTVSGNTIRRTSDAAGDDGFFLEADTTANVTLSVTNNTFARHGGDHINVTMVNNAVVNATITGNTLHGNYAGTPEGNHPIGLGQGIFLFGAAFNGTFSYNVSNNGTVAVPFRGNRQGGAIHVNKGSGTGTFSGRIENNVIGDPAVIGSGSAEAFGIIVGARGAGGSHTTLINNNLVRQYFDRGIVLEAGEGSAALNANVMNNTVANFADALNSLHGIHSDNGILPGDTNAVCLNVSGNSVSTAGNEPAGGADIRLRRGQSTTVSIPGIGGTNNAAATVRIQALNPAATTIAVTGDGFSNIASCPVP